MKSLKTMLAVSLLCAVPLIAKADVAITAENFPDEGLREIVKEWDSDGNGILSGEEIQNFTSISIMRPVADFTGLELLPNLNAFYLYGFNYTGITDVDFNKIPNSKNFIEVSFFDAWGIVSIDLSPLENIEVLDIRYATDLTDLKLPDMKKLKTLGFDGVSQIKSFDFGNLPMLEFFNMNFNSPDAELTDINLQGCSKLQQAYINGISLNCKSINLSGCSELRYVYMTSCHDNEDEKKYSDFAINLDGCDKLGDIRCYGWGGTALDLSKLPSLEHLELTYAYHLQTLSLPSSLTSVILQNTDIKTLDLNECKKLESLEVYDTELSELQGLSNCENLYHLNILRTTLSEIDVTALKKLQNAQLNDNKLLYLDLSSFNDGRWVNMDSQFLLNQQPDVTAVKLSKNEVGIDVTKTKLNVSMMRTLSVNGKDITAKETTVDDSRYLVFYDDADHADVLTEATHPFAYYTGYSYNDSESNVHDVLLTGDIHVSAVTKHQAFLKLASTDVVKGVYGSPAPAAPEVIRSQDYDGKLTYKSSNEKVVTVSADGQLTIIGAGKATITISGAETDYRLAPQDISYEVDIDKATVSFAYAEAEQEMIILDPVPENILSIGVYDGTVKYTSNNTGVATVDANGKVTVLAAGTVKITAAGPETANCYEATAATYTLTIKKKASSIVASTIVVEGIYGGTVDEPVFERGNGYDGKLSYTSANQNIVKVAADGKLTIVGAGETTVTVTGEETAIYYAPQSVAYTVKIAKASPVFSFAKSSIEVDMQETVPGNELNIGIYDGSVTYTSSDTKVAEVDAQSGQITVKGVGKAVITAMGESTDNCNSSSATYELIVKDTSGIQVVKVYQAGRYYTLQGIPVDHPQKGGIYIFNGKKIIIR
ncbi:MAG: Ig-like domain-containing protein [Prevotella sp.]|nr:Ig-like domain-containing protein [Prevotella sp.]